MADYLSRNALSPTGFRHGVVLRAALVAGLGGFLLGFDTVVISGTNDTLERVFQLSKFWLGFTVATAPIGTILGSILIGKPSDAFGRKKALFALAACYFVSALGCGLARGWEELLFARFLGGIAIGGASVVTPMYIAEIAPPRLRGRMVMVNQLNIVAGVLLSLVSNYLIDRCFEPDVAWRWMLGLLALPAGVFFLLIFGVPESPRGLVKRGRVEDARKVLERLGVEDVAGELAAIQNSLADRPGERQERLLQRAYWRPVGLACAMAVFNQLTGINAILYYAPTIFRLAGALRDQSLKQSIAPGIALLVFTIVAMFIIDRFGRRILLLIGSVGMALSLGLLAVAFSHGTAVNGRLVLLGLVGSIAFFAMSQGAVMFVFISEVFPNAVRAKGQALGTFVHWTMASTVTWSFPVVAGRSASGAFGFFALVMVIQFFFAWKVMPETKGGALEDIQKRFSSAGN